ncbi:1,2-diacylglycerol 3-alpha-glucosyltransferase [Gammaproteobacteria bacterium]
MRVLMISDVYFPRINGVSTSIETFRRQLAPLGVETLLVAPQYGQEPDEPGIFRIPARQLPFDPEDRWMSPRTAMQVASSLSGIDLIHIQTPFVAHTVGIKLARRWGIPVVSTYHTLFEEYFHHYLPFLPASLLRGLTRRLSGHQCNALDALIVPSTAMRDRLLSYGVKTPLTILPTGIPVSHFSHGDRQGFRRRHGLSDDQPVALYVGRVAYEKNIEFLLNTLRWTLPQCPDLLLLITGEGPALPGLKTRVRAMGLGERVWFLGYQDRAGELPDIYAASDVFVFASRTETQGLVLLEALASGLPVVALPAMGTRDILDPGQGSVSAPDDPEGFAGALLGVLKNPDRRANLAQEAKVYAQEWLDTVMAKRLAVMYADWSGVDPVHDLAGQAINPPSPCLELH